MNPGKQRQPVAVVTPVYKDQPSELDILSLKQCDRFLNCYPVVLACPEGLNRKAYLDLLPRAEFITFESRFFNNIQSYSELLLSKSFYKNFQEYKYILVCQTDCLIFQNSLLEWCGRNYDYVGAPWFEGFDPKNRKLIGVGNGGLSLRRVEAFLSFFEQLPSNPLINAFNPQQRALTAFIRSGAGEDLFWGMKARNFMPSFNIAPIDEAIYFAFEAGLEHLSARYQARLPFGCHATWNVQRLQDELSGTGEAWDQHTQLLTELFKRTGMV